MPPLVIRRNLRERQGIVRAAFTVALIVAFQVASASPRAAEPQVSANQSYDEFIALNSDARRERLGQMRPETIAALKRTHAERWFAAHGSRLSSAQVAVFVEALEFITVDRYADPDDAGARKREVVLTHKLTCVLGTENTRQAFVLHLPPESAERPGWRSTVDAWLSWFFDCVTP